MTVQPPEGLPPCHRDPEMWASTEPLDHFAARDICLTECDRLEWCAQELKRYQDLARENRRPGPSGTWAGMLVTKAMTVRENARRLRRVNRRKG